MVVISWFINQQTSRVFPILYDDIVLNQKNVGQKMGPPTFDLPKSYYELQIGVFDPTKKILEFSLFLFPKFDPYMFISLWRPCVVIIDCGRW